MESARSTGLSRELLHRALVVVGALALTFLFFMVLPLIQAIGKSNRPDTQLTSVDTAAPPPPDEPEPEPEPEEEEEEPEPEAPELEEQAQPLDLSQLEMALNPTFGAGAFGGDFALQLDNVIGGGAGMEPIFSAADLDQKPRAIYQANPVMTRKLRQRAPGKATITFTVDAKGKVQQPKALDSTDPIFERPAMAAVKQWRFEPGKRKGEAISFRMRVTVNFPK